MNDSEPTPENPFAGARARRSYVPSAVELTRAEILLHSEGFFARHLGRLEADERWRKRRYVDLLNGKWE